MNRNHIVVDSILVNVTVINFARIQIDHPKINRGDRLTYKIFLTANESAPLNSNKNRNMCDDDDDDDGIRKCIKFPPSTSSLSPISFVSVAYDRDFYKL